jgi:hypothetical protein
MSGKTQPRFALTDLILPLGIGAVLLTSKAAGQQQSRAHIAPTGSADFVAQTLPSEKAAVATLRQIALAQTRLASSLRSIRMTMASASTATSASWREPPCCVPTTPVATVWTCL